ncbi:MAG: hypothetical protein ACR2JB_10595 [Bryobacteraceae bacterium]
MTYLDNYRTHYCPDSGFSLVSENDSEFEVCTCFRSAIDQTAVPGLVESEARLARSSPIAAEQLWYRTIAALAKVCGTSKAVRPEPVTEHKNEEVLVTVRKA